jgi:hypothetical protein
MTKFRRIPQKRQAMQVHVTLSRVRVTTVVIEKQCILHVLITFVDLIIQHDKRLHHVAFCSLSDCTTLFHIISQTV